MNPSVPPARCRLVLIAPSGVEPRRLLSALEGGDVASLILPGWDMDEDAFQRHAEAVVPGAQENGVAVMIAGDARIAMRAKADGLHVEGPKRELEDAIARHGGKLMVGTGGVTTRDDALELGEARPDYMFFGRFGYDTKPDPHPRNLKLGSWWAQMIQIPCIVLAGSTVDSVVPVAESGVEFAALGEAAFAGDADPADTVARANALLDEHAPRFEE